MESGPAVKSKGDFLGKKWRNNINWINPMKDTKKLIHQALLEDLGMGDVTTEATVDKALCGRATVIAKSPLVLSGTDLMSLVFVELKEILHCHEVVGVNIR